MGNRPKTTVVYCQTHAARVICRSGSAAGALCVLRGCEDVRCFANTALAATTMASHVLVQLRAPWPTAVGELSSAAARAVREDPTRSAVTFGCSSEEWRRLQQAGVGARLMHADLSSYYAARAHADGRRPVSYTHLTLPTIRLV